MKRNFLILGTLVLVAFFVGRQFYHRPEPAKAVEQPMTTQQFDRLWNDAELAGPELVDYFGTIESKDFPAGVSDLWHRTAFFGGKEGDDVLGGEVFHRERRTARGKIDTKAPNGTTVLIFEMLIRLDSGEYRKLPPISIEIERK